MSSPSSSRRAGATRGKQRQRSGQRPTGRPSKAQAAAPPVEGAVPAAAAGAPSGALPRRRSLRAAATAQVARISREEEYAYIREDMRRLLTIGGGLLVFMLVLLVFVER